MILLGRSVSAGQVSRFHFVKSQKGRDMLKIIPSKAQYNTDDKISFIVQGCFDERINLKIFDVTGIVYEEDLAVIDNRIGIENQVFKKGGYLVEIETLDSIKAQTAFDVATGMIRYGFLSDFFEGDENNNSSINWMNQLHLNYVQYYDWMYRHDNLVPKTEIFEDLLGRELSTMTIQKRIEQSKKRGMQNIAYGAIYGATNEFASEHPEWRLFDKSGKAIGFFDFLSIMNVNHDSGWHHHIINEYKEAIEFGFDGIHMDTYGFPKEAYDANGQLLDLPEDFGQLIDDSKVALKKAKDDIKLIFNNVGNWPVGSVANRDQEAIYIEVWNPYATYQGIEEIIDHARRENNEKQIILAAYLKPFENEVTEKTYNALLLLTAVITTLGATHLIHGEDGGIITEGYYAKYYQVESEEVRNRIVRYYDYITFLSDFWKNNILIDVSKTHFLGDNREYVSDSHYLTPNLEAGKLYINIRQNETYKFINFINLTASKDDIWNKEKDIAYSSSFKFKILLSKDVKEVTYLTPDHQDIQITRLEYAFEESEFGVYLVLEIPEILIWSTLIVEMDD